MPVQQYTGGVEHAILHLLYSRFFTKALKDLGLVGFDEPFLRHRNQGQVIMEGASMSKSKGNLVEFAEERRRWGADVVRATMLFASPPEADVDWATVSQEGVRNWLQRVFRLVQEAVERGGSDGEELRRFTHRTVRTVTELMERFRLNVVIARLMELTNEIRATLDASGSATEATRALVAMLGPLAPFVAEELWREVLGESGSVHMAPWPTFDDALAAEDTVTLVVSVDGKPRDRIEVPASATEESVRELALASEKARRALGDREVANVIVRAPRVANIVSR
jgi:leucyl-tRNA synthetase